MKLKVFTVVAESTGRQNKTLGEKIEETVKGFLESLKTEELVDVKIDAEFGVGNFGKALIVVLYRTK